MTMTVTLSNPLRPAILAASRSGRMERTVSRSRLSHKLVTRFVPGAEEAHAVAAVKDLVQAGRFVSVDYLGEDISHAGEAEDTVQAYLSLLQAYGRLGVEPGTDTRAATPPGFLRCRSSSPPSDSLCRAAKSSRWATPDGSAPPPRRSAPG